jgi:protein phosphatase
MVARGMITAEEAKRHPQRNIITRALGTGAYVEVDTFTMPVQAGDVYLLCSDGLSNHVGISKMHAITTGAGSWEDKLAQLVEVALNDGGSDNITVALMDID